VADSDIEKAKKEQQKILADTEYGQKARVQRHDIQNYVAEKANRELREIGEQLIKPVNAGHETWKYKGSASVHVYQSEMLGEVIFLEQVNTMQDVPEVTASKAFSNLKQSLIEMYQGSRQYKRSGF